MTIFEYIMVMVSKILALALAQLLRALTELITSTRRYWVHMIWVVILVLMVVQFWWAYWDFNAIQIWTFDTYIVLAFLFWSVVFVLIVPRQEIANTNKGFLLIGFLWMTVGPAIATYFLPRWLLKIMPLMNGYRHEESGESRPFCLGRIDG